VLVKLNYQQNKNLPQVNRKLTAMGTHEQITIYMATGRHPSVARSTVRRRRALRARRGRP